MRVVSACAGDGRDLLGVLSSRSDAERVTALLVEYDARLAERARSNASALGAAIDVRRADAAQSDIYLDAAPADLVLLCGIFGNISNDDVRTTIEAAPALCAPGAEVVWTRHRKAPDLTPDIRNWFTGAGFEEVAFVSPDSDVWAVGVHRYVGEPVALRAGEHWYLLPMIERLTPQQRALLATWLPDLHVVADLSWGLVETAVLEVMSGEDRLIVKAGGPSDHHLERELRAHREWLAPWVSTGHAPALLFRDESAKLLVTRYLPGVLVEGDAAQDDPSTYAQAGALLATFHAQHSVVDPTWNDKLRARVDWFLAQPHRIDPVITDLVVDEVAGWPSGGALVVPTHGDWQPRNWLIDNGVVRIIDFGRADLRPPIEDFVRIARQDFVRNPDLEAAFIDGYGDDPREPASWRRSMVAEAVGTAVWAYGVGDEDFENLGHRLLAGLFLSA